jgi:DNA-binding transcriptional LysR family regulator
VDTKQLQCLVVVVDRASFSQAADHLGVTQPAVSLAIRSLERRLGTTLIDRSGRTVAPTEAGQIVYRHAQRILAQEQELISNLSEEQSAIGGSLVVGASTGPGERVLPQLLGAFRLKHPEVLVSLRVDDTDTVVDRVADRQLELGIVGAERPHRSLVFEPFLRDELVLLTPAGHPFAGREITLEELKREPLVIQQEGSGVRSVVERELRAAGVKQRDLNVIAELGLQESAKTAVEAGLGVTFMSRLAIEGNDGRFGVARVAGLDPNRLFYSVRPASRSVSRVLRTFLEFARAELGDRAAALDDGDSDRPVRGARVG